MIKRSFTASIRATEPKTITGYALKWGDKTSIYGIKETIRPGAFRETLKTDDILFFMAHNPDKILGRARKNLKLFEDETGLKFELEVPETSEGKDAYELVRKEIVTGASIGMRDYKSEDTQTERVITQVELSEVSLTARPAYKSSEAKAREEQAEITCPPDIL